MTEIDDEDLAGSLCLDCGLCCDGTLFTQVRIDADDQAEAPGISFPLETDSDGNHFFRQRCPHLSACGCSVYDDRPGKCQAFSCKLLKAVNNSDLNVDRAKEIVAEIQENRDWLTAHSFDNGPVFEAGSSLRRHLYRVLEVAKKQGSLDQMDPSTGDYVARASDHVKLIYNHIHRTSLYEKYRTLMGDDEVEELDE